MAVYVVVYPLAACATSIESLLDCRTVIAFLVVTSIINLALGYALAVYLGAGTSSSFGQSQADGSIPSESFEPALTSWTQGAPPTTRETAAQPTESPSSFVPTPSSLPEEQPAAERPEWPERSEGPSYSNAMDQELLAGIEEFRHQLAQLKTQGLNDVIPNPVGSDAVDAR